MEAATATRAKAAQRFPGSAALAELGDLAAFSSRVLLELPGALRYFGELLRQCGILIAGSAIVLVGVSMVGGAECALFGDYTLKGLGAQAYVGFFTSVCGVIEFLPLLFGWIFAAKVGCGLVAEIGSMRISEELDAMESVGVSPMRYVVGTRLLAVWITVPLIYVVSLFASAIAAYLVVSVQLGNVSRAAWESVHWGSQTVLGNTQSLIKAVVFATAVVLISCYYGYRARGGAVGVGSATARSMVVNLVVINILNGLGTALFFTNPRLPIGG